MTTTERREVLAEVCKLLLERNRGLKPTRAASQRRPAQFPSLSPRLMQTLELLLNGAGEKQIAQQLNLSQHTVHVYVKALHKGFGVSSRGELLSKFVANPRAPFTQLKFDS